MLSYNQDNKNKGVMDMKMSANLAIKKIAKEQGLSYQQLGARLGLKNTSVSRRLNDGGRR